MFLGKDSNSELSNKLMLIVDNIEHIKNKASLKSYEIVEDNLLMKIMALIEKYTENVIET